MKGKRCITSLPFGAWPDCDRELWLRSVSEGGYFDRDGKAAHWAPATKQQVAKGYAKWLFFLDEAGYLDADVLPSSRIDEARLEGYVEWLANQGLASMTITSRVCDLREAIRIMEQAPDLTILSDALRALRARQAPSRDKHARLVHPKAILERTFAYLEELPAVPCPNDLIRASWYRDGIAVAFLASRPVRLKNLTNLRIGNNLIRTETTWRCDFGAHETKERRPLAFTLPPELGARMDRYMKLYRPPLLRDRRSDHLWISTRGGPISQQGLYIGIRVTTERLFGHPINPHLFRACAATSIATQDPEHVLASARMLGHGSIETTTRNYNQSAMIDAIELLHETLLAIKHQEHTR